MNILRIYAYTVHAGCVHVLGYGRELRRRSAQSTPQIAMTLTRASRAELAHILYHTNTHTHGVRQDQTGATAPGLWVTKICADYVLRKRKFKYNGFLRCVCVGVYLCVRLRFSLTKARPRALHMRFTETVSHIHNTYKNT